MALIVEDGTGTLASESYATVSFADTYHLNRNNVLWGAQTTTVKEAALRKGTDYMGQVYRSLWKGFRVLKTQYLDWPRTQVYLPNEVYQNSDPLDLTVIPIEIQKACVELALKSLSDTLLLIDTEQQIVKEVIGPLTTEYQATGNKYKHYTAIEQLLKPYLNPVSLSVLR